MASGCDNPTSAQPCPSAPPPQQAAPASAASHVSGAPTAASRGPDDLELLKQEVKEQVPGKTTFPPTVAAAMGSSCASGGGGEHLWTPRQGEGAGAGTAGSCCHLGLGRSVPGGVAGTGRVCACPKPLSPYRGAGLPRVMVRLARSRAGQGSLWGQQRWPGTGQPSPIPPQPLWFLCRRQQERAESLMR